VLDIDDGDVPAIVTFRRMLKCMGRSFLARCVAAVEVDGKGLPDEPAPTPASEVVPRRPESRPADF
jgi:hypothetical protein